ncbi:M67 family metallopeptidase [Iamia sp.]|uniref:M67 family metallopeptidase n=1 Tax=Iamia sp. TaxID=2722710 RepID=UPI002D03F99F|nr:M67 family metallopeptidase [Iamia sp.]HXH58949.1 M67 family metallopeptidase [Iamia sp.]
MLTVDPTVHDLIVAHALGGFPDEACGLLGGRIGPGPDRAGLPVATVRAFVATRNHDASSRTYTIGPEGFLAADRQLGPLGLDVIGVAHSHTHSEAWPSPTDLDKADNPLLEGWHYVIVSLRDASPVLRSFLLDGRAIREEAVVVVAT